MNPDFTALMRTVQPVDVPESAVRKCERCRLWRAIGCFPRTRIPGGRRKVCNVCHRGPWLGKPRPEHGERMRELKSTATGRFERKTP